MSNFRPNRQGFRQGPTSRKPHPSRQAHPSSSGPSNGQLQDGSSSSTKRPPNLSRRYFDKVMLSDAEIDEPDQAKLFLQAIVTYDDEVELLHRLTSKKENGTSGLIHALTAHDEFRSPSFVNDYVTKFLIKCSSNTWSRGIFKVALDHMLFEVFSTQDFIWFKKMLDLIERGEIRNIIPFGWLTLQMVMMDDEPGQSTRDHEQIDLMKRAAKVMSQAGNPIAIRIQENILTVLDGSFPLHNEGRASSSLADLSYVPGGRHDNDELNYRDICILPTPQEITCDKPPYLPHASNRSSSDAKLLDRQFRLNREEFVASLREEFETTTNRTWKRACVSTYFTGKVNAPSGAPHQNMQGRNKSSMIPKGYILISFTHNTPLARKSEWWDKKKRLLGFESLVCLVQDGQPICFGLIAERDSNKLAHDPPQIGISPCTPDDLRVFLQLQINRDDSSTLVQCDALFKPIEAILKGLQRMSSVPFESELVRWSDQRDLKPIEPNYQSNAYTRMLERLKRGEDVTNILPRMKAGIVLDESQKKAITLALKTQVALTQGPPGTGKSLVGALITRAIYDHTDETILIVCYTNHALDQFLHDLHDDAGIPYDQMVRVGGGKKVDPTLDPIRINTLAFNGQASGSRSFGQQMAITCKSIEATQDSIEEIQVELKRSLALFYHLKHYHPDSWFDRFHVVLNAGEVLVGGGKGKKKKNQPVTQYYLFNAWESGAKAEGVVLELLNRHDRFQTPDDREIWNWTKDKRMKQLNEWRQEAVKDQLEEYVLAVRELEVEQAKRMSLNDDKKSSVLNGRRIIGCTTSGATMYRSLLETVRAGVMVVEEAGEILESHILTSLSSEPKHLIMIGDHQQLRPKVNSYQLQVESKMGYDLNRSLFERLIIDPHHPYPFSTLLNQHRMHPLISGLVRQMTYPHLLDDPNSVNDQTRSMIRGLQRRIVFMDHRHLEDSYTTFHKNKQQQDETDRSKTNSFEVEMVLHTLFYLLQQGYEESDIVILTPYLGQVAAIRDELKKHRHSADLNELDEQELHQVEDKSKKANTRPDDAQSSSTISHDSKGAGKHPHPGVKLSTIDNYQGEESNIVISSLVRSNPEGKIGFVGQKERVNVLLSRARCGLILIGNSQTLTEGPKNQDGKQVWTQVLAQLREPAYQAIFAGLPVQCQRHPKELHVLSQPSDFQRFTPDGGCMQPCTLMMNCAQHACSKKCHHPNTKDEHDKILCRVILQQRCPADIHMVSYQCHERGTSAANICHKCDRIRKAKEQEEARIQQAKQALFDLDAKLAEINTKLRGVKEEQDRQVEMERRAIDIQIADMTLTLSAAANQQEAKLKIAKLQKQAKKKLKEMQITHQTKLRQLQNELKETNNERDATEQIIHPSPPQPETVPTSSSFSNRTIDPTTVKILKNNISPSGASVSTPSGSQTSPLPNITKSSASNATSNKALPDPASSSTAHTKLPLPISQPIELSNMLVEGIRLLNSDALKARDYFKGRLLTSNNIDFCLLELYAQVISQLVSPLEALGSFNELKSAPPSNTIIAYFVRCSINHLVSIQSDVLSDQVHACQSDAIDAANVFLQYASGLKTTPKNWIADISGILDQIDQQSKQPQTKSKALSPAEVQNERWQNDKSVCGAQSSSLDGLMKLTGLSHVKKQMIDTFHKANIQREQGISIAQQRFGSIFTGNPGTGKTTVARIYSEFFIEIGALPKGAKMIETTGAKLASGGQKLLTEFIAELEKLGGGVLFIDEAYQLAPKSSLNGKDVLNLLLTEMENKMGKFIIILAGYHKEMEELLSFNDGFKSRFPYTFQFDDYEDDELLTIANGVIQKRNGQTLQPYRIDGGLHGPYMQAGIRRLGRGRGRKGFGNARAVENMIQCIFDRQCARIQLERNSGTSIVDVFQMTKEDILGPRPTRQLLHSSPAWQELAGMIGLKRVKDKITALAAILEKNYDLELENKPIQDISLNRVFLGNPGTGKTTVARLYGSILKHLGVLSKGDLIQKETSDFIGAHLGQSESQTKSILAASEGCVLMIDEAYGLNPRSGGATSSSGSDSYRSAVVDTLVANVHNKPGDDRCVLMLGYKDEMETFFKSCNPGAQRRFGWYDPFVFDDFSPVELLSIISASLKKKSLEASAETMRYALDCLEKQKLQSNFGNAGAVDVLISSAINNRSVRIEAIPNSHERMVEDGKRQLIASDFSSSSQPTRSIEDIFSEIVGNSAIKEEVRQLKSTMEFAKKKGRADPFADIPFTFLFMGPPGTGKTTVARLMGEVFHSLGVLPTSSVVQKKSSDFTTGFLGQSAIKTREIFKESLGKVLFIDEAYGLSPADGHNYGQEIIDELCGLLTDEQFKSKMIVILAGYENEVRNLLSRNRGLKSRFPTEFIFVHFSVDDCWKVFASSLKHKGLVLRSPPELDSTSNQLMGELIHSTDWGNGRDVNTLVSNLVGLVARAENIDEDENGNTYAELTQLHQVMQTMLEQKMKSSSSTSTTLSTPIQPYAPPAQSIATGTRHQTHSQSSTVTPVASSISQTPSIEEERKSEMVQSDESEVIDHSVTLIELSHSSRADGRDPGVSDEVWKCLLAAKELASIEERDQSSRLTRVLSDLEDLEFQLTLERDSLLATEQRLAMVLDAQKRAVLEARLLKQREEEERIRMELARLEAERCAIEDARRREAAIQARIRELGVCVAGYRWVKQSGGYRCSGGSHFLSDTEIGL